MIRVTIQLHRYMVDKVMVVNDDYGSSSSDDNASSITSNSGDGSGLLLPSSCTDTWLIR